MYEDKTLICKECGYEFVFTAGEQEFYASKGFENEPQRCKACRQNRKNAAKPEREMYTAVCAACGKEATVPCPPPQDRPVYCSECCARMKEARYALKRISVPGGRLPGILQFKDKYCFINIYDIYAESRDIPCKTNSCIV